LIVTTGFINHDDIDAYLGVVSGSGVLGIGVSRDIMASIKDVLGGRIKGYEGQAKEAVNIALLSMNEEAAKRGAEAVMGVRLEVTVFSPSEKGTVVGVVAYGTAAKLKGRSRVPTYVENHNTELSFPGEDKRIENLEGVGFNWGK
jgi:uncharacterized protein YbjQ (UPF0145 family)